MNWRLWGTNLESGECLIGWGREDQEREFELRQGSDDGQERTSSSDNGRLN